MLRQTRRQLPGGPDALGGFALMYSCSRWDQAPNGSFNHEPTLQGPLDTMVQKGLDTRVDYWQGDFDQTDPTTPGEDANAALYKIASYRTLSDR